MSFREFRAQRELLSLLAFAAVGWSLEENRHPFEAGRLVFRSDDRQNDTKDEPVANRVNCCVFRRKKVVHGE